LLAFISSSIRGFPLSRLDNVYLELLSFIHGDFLSRPSQIYQFFSEAIMSQPFFNGHYSFAALCKHYLPFIYLMGIVQILLKILFPLSVIPLYFGLKDKEKSSGSGFSGRFIFLLWLLFVGLAYYFLLKNDFIASRYLMIPAFLLLPWIGVGLNKLYSNVSISLHKKTVLFLVLVIVLAPAVKTMQLTSSRDRTTSQTIKWLKDNDKISKVQIVSNDYKLAFYIDLGVEEKTSWKTHYVNRLKTSIDTNEIEEFALKIGAEIVIIKVKTKKIANIKDLQMYQKINSFVGDRFTIIIYSRTTNK
jgi:hypothetical protein